MKKINCEVVRIDRYTVEFDEDVCNEEWMADFRNFFYDFYDLEQHAEHIAQYRARFGRGFIEGYGIPLENGEVPYWVSEKDKDKVTHAINIKVVSEDNDVDVYVG